MSGIEEPDVLKTVNADELSAACDALGEIMLAMEGRRLLAQPMNNPVIRAKIAERDRTDEQLGKVAALAFERAAMALAKIGYPGATMFECNPTEEP